MINNPPKFIIIVIALLGLLILVGFGRVEWDQVDAWFGTIVGYGVGNGIAALRDQPHEPIFGRKGSRS